MSRDLNSYSISVYLCIRYPWAAKNTKTQIKKRRPRKKTTCSSVFFCLSAYQLSGEENHSLRGRKTLDCARKGGNIGHPRFFAANTHFLAIANLSLQTAMYVTGFLLKLLTTGARQTNTLLCIRIHKSVFEYTKVYSNTLLCIVTSYCNKLHAVIHYPDCHE